MKADKKKVCHLIKTAKGQLDGILTMIEENRYCMDISAQILAVEAVLKKANQEILSAHIASCLAETLASGNEEDAQKKIEELMGVIGKM
ncbi:MAG: metal-sensing transcriptional repressor [Clostridia bacterium]|nr:metal-sensing transcriptional repressor [Clostridia bacterium]